MLMLVLPRTARSQRRMHVSHSGREARLLGTSLYRSANTTTPIHLKGGCHESVFIEAPVCASRSFIYVRVISVIGKCPGKGNDVLHQNGARLIQDRLYSRR